MFTILIVSIQLGSTNAAAAAGPAKVFPMAGTKAALS